MQAGEGGEQQQYKIITRSISQRGLFGGSFFEAVQSLLVETTPDVVVPLSTVHKDAPIAGCTDSRAHRCVAVLICHRRGFDKWLGGERRWTLVASEGSKDRFDDRGHPESF